ncbi:hypothetical protein [Methylomonas sp. AM2-LC]|uniref:hypothetical protein n=1 Tax=Methylomonas sp. AM2-LC TaxID=3153301 RepID=UPI0032634D2F
MQLPTQVIPILEAVSKSPVAPKNTPIEIWKANNHSNCIDLFMELGIALFNSDIAEEGLPKGYILVAYLFDWEAQCQFSGWYAFGNREATIQRVIDSYKAVGLRCEADALERGYDAWLSTDGDVDAVTTAYNDLPNEYTVDIDRMEFLVSYFVDNANSLFYL